MSMLLGTGTRIRLRLPGAGRILPERTAILLTNPRSGSTWLLDLLRAHPRIGMERRATVFRALRMEGRRYPRDLSGGEDAVRRIEVRPGRWEAVPVFAAGGGERGVRDLPPCGIEKCHPHFFDHRVERFVEDLALLQRATRVRMVYQVREPRTSIVSFLRYQERDPSWNAERGPVQVAAHMRRIYESLLSLARRLPGAVVDYGGLKRDLAGTVGGLLESIWERDDPGFLEGQQGVLEGMAAATRREERAAGGGSFLGASESRVDEETEALFRRCTSDLAAADEAYRRLLDLPGRIGAGRREGT
ncbi:MAG: hypothetical protein R6W82_01395 [bacterium]